MLSVMFHLDLRRAFSVIFPFICHFKIDLYRFQEGIKWREVGSIQLIT